MFKKIVSHELQVTSLCIHLGLFCHMYLSLSARKVSWNTAGVDPSALTSGTTSGSFVENDL